MNDESDETMDALAKLSPRDVEILRELLENIKAGRRVVIFLSWVGGIATAIAGFLFYLSGILWPPKH